MHVTSRSWPCGAAALFLCGCECCCAVTSSEPETEAATVGDVNRSLNHRIVFADDASNWGRPDYWATPEELLARGRGDCEDYAVAKFFALQAAGIPGGRVRLVYALVSLGSLGDMWRPHMVVAYLPADESQEVLILDNLLDEVRPVSRRPDLRLLISFDAQGVWRSLERGRPQRSALQIHPWADVLARMSGPH